MTYGLSSLQVVRHFWERNDVKGAINAMMKLPDHSVSILQIDHLFGVLLTFLLFVHHIQYVVAQVQADVVSVLKEKMEIITLELFSCLLPVLLSLLDSKIDR